MAAAEVAGDEQRPAARLGHDHGVPPLGLARATQVGDGVARAAPSLGVHGVNPGTGGSPARCAVVVEECMGASWPADTEAAPRPGRRAD